MTPNRNMLWATVIAQELVRSGVHHVALAPGSRSAPLALAFHAETGLKLTVHHDERSAAFFALGIGKATGRPAAVLTTSGTAAANLLPAIVEASQARVPLLALTADRPPELHDVGANQSIDQQRLFGGFPRWFADAGLPEPEPGRIRHLRALACRAVAQTMAWPAGPVHLNLPLREPLDARRVPGDVLPEWHQGDLEAAHGRGVEPFVTIAAPHLEPNPAALDEIADDVVKRPRGLIVCGPREASDEFPAAIQELSRAAGYPILADPLSGVRYGTDPNSSVISAYDAFLAHGPARSQLAPDLVLRFGASPTSKTLIQFLSDHRQARQVLIDEAGRLGEETHGAASILAGPAPSTARALAARLARRRPPAEPAWTAAWARHDQLTRSILDAGLRGEPFEGALVARIVEALPPQSALFVSNSLPVRDLDRFAPARPRPLRVLANRGASGIDGIPSTAFGAAYALGRPLTLLAGDLAFLHDLGGLATAGRLRLPVHVILFNNGGGGIFEFLPVAHHEPPFTELFVAPHRYDLGRLSESVGLNHRRLSAAEAMKADLSHPGDATTPAVTEIVTDRKANVERRRALDDAVAAALGSPSHEVPHAN